MDMAERSARLQDALYFVEEHIQRDGYEPDKDYVMVANNIAKNIMKMAKLMGLEEEHSYIQGHVDTIEKVVKEKGLEESIMKRFSNYNRYYIFINRNDMNLKLYKTVSSCLRDDKSQFINNLITDTVGKEGKKYFSLVFSLFMFILFGNLFGMIPYSFTFTSHIIVTIGLALAVFLFVTF